MYTHILYTYADTHVCKECHINATLIFFPVLPFLSAFNK